MNLNEEYYKLCYTLRIHEFFKIDLYKNWPQGEARKKYKSLDEFYKEELNIDDLALKQLRSHFKRFNDLYSKYFNEQRKGLFQYSEKLIEWYGKYADSCHYCGVTQSELHRIVESRNGNLTLNQKTKRSKGTLEIEKMDPGQDYTFENAVLCCPFCNNAKSNLISEAHWREFFVPAMKKYHNSILHNDNR